MNAGHFYFIKDEYFRDFPDPYLMQNRGPTHDRPCFYAFQDLATEIFWLIPFSSKVEKFRLIYQTKTARYGRCDTIEFGQVLGYEKAFLIQNMCPITEDYVKEEYIDSRCALPVRVSGDLELRLIQKAKRVLALQRRGVRLIYPDVLVIEKRLLEKRQK